MNGAAPVRLEGGRLREVLKVVAAYNGVGLVAAATAWADQSGNDGSHPYVWLGRSRFGGSSIRGATS